MKETFLKNFTENEQKLLKLMEEQREKIRNEYENRETEIIRKRGDVNLPTTTSLKARGLEIIKDENMGTGLFGIGKRVEIEISKIKRPGEIMLEELPENEKAKIKAKIYILFDMDGKYRGAVTRNERGGSLDLFHITSRSICTGNQKQLDNVELNAKTIAEKIEIIRELQEVVDPTSLLNSSVRIEALRTIKERALNVAREEEGQDEEDNEEEQEVPTYECEICGEMYYTRNRADNCCEHYHCRHCNTALEIGEGCDCAQATAERGQEEPETRTGGEQGG